MSRIGEPRDKLSREQRKAVISAYQAGRRYIEIAEEFNITDSAVWGIVKRANLPTERNIVTKEDIGRVFSVSQQGRIKSVEPLTDLSPPNSRKPVDEDAFTYVTEESAYWIGLLMADGSIVGNQIILQLSGEDAIHIDAFKNFLKSDHTITVIQPHITSQGWVNSGARRIAIGSTRMIEALNAHGVDKGKTFNARAKLLYEHPDFWRGVVDGDGNIRDDGLRAYGAKPLMEQFLKFVKRLHPTTKAECKPHSRIWGVSLNGKSAKLTATALYNTDGPAIERKRTGAFKLLDFLDQPHFFQISE